MSGHVRPIAEPLSFVSFVLFVVHSDSLDVRVIRVGKGEETTKSTKDTKKSKNATFDAVFQERCVEVEMKRAGLKKGTRRKRRVKPVWSWE